MSSGKLQLGVTLHSFVAEWLSYQYSFEDMIEKTAQLGGGVEVVGPSHIRGFPRVSPEFERTFRSAIERHGVTPTCFAAYADPFTLPDRDYSADEIYDFTVPQLEGASRLGFPTFRLQYFHASAAPKLLPLAERLGIKMGYELHVPLMIKSEKTLGLIEQIDRLGSPYLGLIPDAGVFTHTISSDVLSRAPAVGLSTGQMDIILDLWNRKVEFDGVLDTVGNMGLSDDAMGLIATIWDHFGFSKPEEIEAIGKYIIHMHAKFYDMQDGEDPYIPYRDIVKALHKIGYSGWISSELEGSMSPAGSSQAFRLVSEQQAALRRYWDEAEANAVVA